MENNMTCNAQWKILSERILADNYYWIVSKVESKNQIYICIYYVALLKYDSYIWI